MTIGKRLQDGFRWVLILVGVLFLVNLFALFYLRSVRKTEAAAFENMKQVEEIRAQMINNELALNNYLMTGIDRDLKSFNDGQSKLSQQVANIQDRLQKGTVDNLTTTQSSWINDFANPLLAKRKEVNEGNANANDLQIAYITKNSEFPLEKAIGPADKLVDSIQKELDSTKSSGDLASNVTFFLSFLVFAVVIAAAIKIARDTSSSITDPLSHLNMVVRDIGESGDLDKTVDINRDDEIGDLARTFNHMIQYLKEMAAVSEAIAGGDLTVAVEPRSKSDTLALAFQKMTEGLRTLVRHVRDSAAQVASGSNQVADASDDSAKVSVQASSAIDEVTSTMHEMSVNVQNMVKNTQTQASSVSETSASIDQMVASIQRVADTSKVLLDISQRSRDEVQSGITTMEKTTDGLNRINHSILASSEIITALGQRADDIGKIVEVIDDLAEQTNLLALNAAIEAARAGEHGLGFAVVAEEVRKLAEKSASSTKEISDLIASIQKEARKAVDNMEKSTNIVNEGLDLGTALSTALKKISNVVTEVYKFAQEIGAATNEQSHGSSQIARATTRLNEITHEINSAVEEQASGAQAVVRAMEKMRELVQQSTSGSTELAASAEQMSKMARALLESMDRFAIDTSPNGNASIFGSRRSERSYA